MTILFLCREDNLVREIRGYARAFRRRGVRVACVEHGFPLNGSLAHLLERCPERPALVFHPESDYTLLPWGLSQVGIPTALLQADPYAYTHRRVRWAMLFDYVLLLHGGFEERFRKAGHPRPVTLPHAVDEGIFQGRPAERVLEVSSVGRGDGRNYRTRRKVLAELSDRFRTNQWWRRHSYEEMAQVYQASKIVVNVPRDDFPVDVSLRFAEAMAAGALFITRLPSELASLGFEENVHFAGFRERGELAGLVRRYLRDEAARKRIADAGQEKVLREHTYACRVDALLRRLEQDSGQLFAPARQWSEERARRVYLDYYAANGCLDCAYGELRQIARQSLRHAMAGASLIARAWVRQSRNWMAARVLRHS